MIEITLEEWGNRTLDSKRYKVVAIKPSKGETTVFDSQKLKFYRAKYNMETHMMNLFEVL